MYACAFHSSNARMVFHWFNVELHCCASRIYLCDFASRILGLRLARVQKCAAHIYAHVSPVTWQLKYQPSRKLRLFINLKFPQARILNFRKYTRTKHALAAHMGMEPTTKLQCKYRAKCFPWHLAHYFLHDTLMLAIKKNG